VWKAALTRWRAVNRRFKTEVRSAAAPDTNEEYLIYQTLIGAWPFERDPDAQGRFETRIVAYLKKALREAKLHTSWLNPDEEYEAAVERFVRSILARRKTNLFLESFSPLQETVAQMGIYNSLAQLLIKITAPGVPDFYQGTEFWDLNLVDPDNRRPVDYEARRDALAQLERADPVSLLVQRNGGRVKLFVAARALATRALRRDQYERGGYVPIQTDGSRQDCLFAFSRGDAITCVPRLIATLSPDGQPPLGEPVWGDTSIRVADGGPLRDVFTGIELTPARCHEGYALRAADIFDRFPVALLVPASPPLSAA